jgi:hypothetical protein
LIEVTQALGLSPTLCATIHCRALQDNQAAYLLASTQRITNRTKYYLVKWHWFWDNHAKGHFDIQKVGTTEMKADCLTKGLARPIFEQCRKMNQGW